MQIFGSPTAACRLSLNKAKEELPVPTLSNHKNYCHARYVNKEIFKLYWCLETVCEFVDCINYDKIKKIILKSKSVQEYTIREKTAKILSKINCDTELAAIKKELNNDANCFVRRYVTQPSV